ncbi:glucosamine inositolphosphorylceramide transferase family protein [Lutimonas zeaxanthinifaciens]|uniref:glucosamine inositolphosphorylceramide transferase family protein n=1 Tax=Lutimonas zeaxanthinifaciens TaxID=3060215 RepID=UPI00265D0374|nr:hypothetical protein [Lutimonas sp. YSD2104]WKK66839.1 hypothetical protein QZH61_04275 [Lutimonas sp. YSD2104]
MKTSIKIDILLDSDNIQFWIFCLLKKIHLSNQLDLNIIYINNENSKNNFGKHANDSIIINLLNLAYLKVEDYLFSIQPDALKTIEIDEYFKNHIKYCDLKNKINNDLIKGTNGKPDLVLNLSTISLDQNPYTLPKFGIWFYTIGSYSAETVSEFSVMEVLKKIKQTRLQVNVIKNFSSKTECIYESFSSTDDISIKRNNNKLMWKVCGVIMRKLNNLQKEQIKSLKTEFHSSENYLPDKSRNFKTLPSELDYINSLFKNYLRSFQNYVYNKKFVNQWFLLFQFECLNLSPKIFNQYIRIIPPEDRFWADPFVIKKFDTYYVFVEELIFSENIGYIVLIEIDQYGNYSQPKTILKKDYHLSYPFLIEDNDELYMIPESSEKNRIEIYHCTDFPLEWKLKKVLFKEIKAVDTTIFKHNNVYWLFCNISEMKGAPIIDDLFLYYSDSLLSAKWIEHPSNPIVSNSKNSRSAGAVFKKENRIFRPSQNCTNHYGYGIEIMEIINLTKTEYKEINFQSIRPTDLGKNCISTHTINHNSGMTILDAQIKRKRLTKN